jgi:hypothetical protein
MAEHNRTCASLVQIARQVYPVDVDLAELRAMEAFDEEQLAADACQA